MKKDYSKYYKIKGSLGIYISLVILIILIIFTIFFSIQNHLKYKKSVVNQWEKQLLTTTRISALNIESFVTKYSENLLSLSNNPVIKKRTISGSANINEFCFLQNLYNIHKIDINAILLLKNKGEIIKKIPNWDTSSKCPNYCKTGILYSQNPGKGEIIVGDIFINHIQNSAFTISCPVFNQEKFTGILRWMIEIENISSKYIDSFIVGENGYMWMLDNKNIIRAHHKKSLLNRNIDNILTNFISDENLKKVDKKDIQEHINSTHSFFTAIKQKDEGSGKIIDFAHNEYSLAVFKKVFLGDKSWTIIMNIPYSEITGPIYKNALKTSLFTLVIAIVLITLFIIFYQSQKSRIKLEKETKYLAEIASSSKKLKEEKEKRLTALLDGQEIERNRVSREIHDGLGQYLLTIKMKLENLYSKSQPNIKEEILNIKNHFLNTIDEVKKISNNLMPVALDEIEIETVIQNLCTETESINNKKIDYVSHGIPENINPKQKRYLYRISQEALNNVIKHAKTSEINVQFLGNNEQITLIIQDNGIGFNYNKNFKSSGNGINNMIDRVNILNGNISILSAINEGTKITIKIPLKS
ncbi:MAG: cache domain-containing protein [Bacteroidota bacterium]|nr:cache domain-containing protein [Bacteroidota bacterium]